MLFDTFAHAILTGTAMFKAARQSYQSCLGRVLAERICLYCGLNGDAWDENIPTSIFNIVYRISRERRIEPRVPICRECDRLSAWRSFRTPEEKRRCIRTQLRSKYSTDLNTADWHEQEVEELGYGLATAVKAGVAGKQKTLHRIVWPRLRMKDRIRPPRAAKSKRSELT